jgi:hypothetical protein
MSAAQAIDQTGRQAVPDGDHHWCPDGRSTVRPGHDVMVRAIVAISGIGTDPEEYPVDVFHEPLGYDLRDADEVAALVVSLVQFSGNVKVPPPINQTGF